MPRKWCRDENGVKHPIPAPRRKHLLGGKISIPAPRTKIGEKRRALNGYTKSYEIGIESNFSVLEQLQNTRLATTRYFDHIFNQLGGFKFVETLVVNFVKPGNDEENRDSIFINSSQQTVINSTDFLPSLNMSQQQIMARIGRWMNQGSGYIINSVNDRYINVVKYNPLGGNSYIPLPPELQHPRKRLINMENENDECFRWCHIRHLNPQERNPQRIKSSDRELAQRLIYNGVEFLVSVKDYNKIEAQYSINIDAFGYEGKQFFPIYVSKQKNTDELNLVLITDGEKQHYVLIKDFNQMMYNISKSHHSKHFCMYCLQHFTTKSGLDRHKENCLIIKREEYSRI